MRKEERLVVTFHTTSEAIAMESSCRRDTRSVPSLFPGKSPPDVGWLFPVPPRRENVF